MEAVVISINTKPLSVQKACKQEDIVYSIPAMSVLSLLS